MKNDSYRAPPLITWLLTLVFLGILMVSALLYSKFVLGDFWYFLA